VIWPSRCLLLLAAAGITASLICGCGEEKNTPAAPSELEEALGFSREGALERQTRVESQIRECMKAQGFEYKPVDPYARQRELSGKERQTDEEFTRRFGYGISTLFGRADEQSDPNVRIRRSLSPAERASYDRALWGEKPGATFVEAVESGDFSELGGCTRQASEAAFGGSAVLTVLTRKLDDLDSRILGDSRMASAVQNWSACMVEKGYRFKNPDDIDGEFEKRFRALMGVGVPPGATAPPDPETSYDPAALGRLQREEVKTATADLDCERREITPVERVVRPQYEKAFRQQNQTLLARVRPVE
jgi:hypothetical protein